MSDTRKQSTSTETRSRPSRSPTVTGDRDMRKRDEMRGVAGSPQAGGPSRRCLLACAGFVMAPISACTGGGSQPGDSDEPTFRLPKHPGREETVSPGWPVSAEPNSAAPTLHGDALYCTEYGGRIRALDSTTGRQRWRVEPGPELAGLDDVNQDTPLVHGGIVIVARHSSSRKGSAVMALDTRSGSELWKRPTSGGVSVVLHADRVLLAESLPRQAGKLYAGSIVRSLNPRTGEVVWETRSPSVSRLLSAGDAIVVFHVSEGNTTAISSLRPSDGRESWRRNMPTNYPHGAQLADDLLVVHNDEQEGNVSTVTAVRISTGKIAWKGTYAPLTTGPTPGGPGRLLISEARTVRALDSKSGSELWIHRTKGDTCYDGLAEGKGTVVCGEHVQQSPATQVTGIRVTLLESDSGTVQATWKGSYNNVGVLAAAQRAVFLSCQNDDQVDIVGVDTRSGKRLWRTPGEGGETLTVGGSAVYLHGEKIDRLDPRTGKRLTR
ncbi:PQQ-like beta-propeller repeat protein [Streptomyces nodosus]|uniref:PQQ-like beta-propeller repeat protein n=1 Tax=Streptomyces nodosus TaxID=40318 RepID=UPI003811F49B